jgi:hypothetical protein
MINNTESLTLKQLNHFTTLSQRQLRNNINILREDSRFSSLIQGGGKGKGGQFRFHYTIIPLITFRQRQKINQSSRTIYSSRLLSEYYFSMTNWDFFGCIYPNTDIDISKLKESLSQYISFFCVHRRKEKNHIHFTINSPDELCLIKKELSSYYSNQSISIDEVFLVDFNSELKVETLNYLLRRGPHHEKRDLIDWGLVIPDLYLPL